MTKFIDCSYEQKETKETVFTHWLSEDGWKKSISKPYEWKKVLYLGKSDVFKDMFACYGESESILIFKGTKGNEF